MNRVNEFADAFSGWMKEYAEKQQVSCGRQPVNGTAHETLCSTPLRAKGHSGNLAPAAGIQSALAEHQKQMDKPLRIVDDMVSDTPASPEDFALGYVPGSDETEESDVRPELEVYRGRGRQE